MEGLVTLIVVLVIALFILRSIVHIVPEYQRLVVFSFGKFQGIRGPGLVLLLPPPIQFVAQRVDLREFFVEIPQQTCITKDNAPISIDFLIYQKVLEPRDSFLNIQNFRTAIQGIATTTLQYLDALKQLGASPSTKFIIPTEFAALAAPLAVLVRGDGEQKK